jgi:hypothetical protein
MAFFKIKSTCPSDFLKNITLRYYEFCSKLYVHTVCLILEVSLSNFSHLQDQYVTHYKKIENQWNYDTTIGLVYRLAVALMGVVTSWHCTILQECTNKVFLFSCLGYKCYFLILDYSKVFKKMPPHNTNLLL